MRADREHVTDPERAASVRPKTAPGRPPRPIAPGMMSAAEVEHLQHFAGNRAVSRTLQRAHGDTSESTPAPAANPARRPLAELLRAGGNETDEIREQLDDRVVGGPLLSDDELAAVNGLDAEVLRTIGIGTRSEADEYLRELRKPANRTQKLLGRPGKGPYTDWLDLAPGRRVLIATLAWNTRRAEEREGGEVPKSPAYTLGRSLTLHGGSLAESERSPLLQERDQQIHGAFVNTLTPPTEDAAKKANWWHRMKDQRAREVLTRVLLILQSGLRIYKETEQGHVDYREGDVVRALAHGGRVHIRIPKIDAGSERYAMTDWLGLTKRGIRKNPLENRFMATHHSEIEPYDGDQRGGFREIGGKDAQKRNIQNFKQNPLLWGKRERIKFFGVDVAADGIGNLNYNGDVILPDGHHGHMLLVFTPPHSDRDGGLQVGIETLAMFHSSPVGYTHDMKSTEATANPESSFYGHKKDKIGEGELADNQRFVELSDLGSSTADWLEYLKALEKNWKGRLDAAKDDREAQRALYAKLAGPRDGFDL